MHPATRLSGRERFTQHAKLATRPLHNPFSAPLYELFDPSMGLLAKSQKTGPHGLKQFGIYPPAWAVCPVKFPAGNPI